MNDPYERLVDSAWSENSIKVSPTDENGNKLISGGKDDGYDFVEVKSSVSRDWVALDDEEMRRAKQAQNDSTSTDKILKNICRKIAAITISANIPAKQIGFNEKTEMTSQEKDQNTSKLVNFYYSMWSMFTKELYDKINTNSLFIETGETNSSATQDMSDGAAQEDVK